MPQPPDRTLFLTGGSGFVGPAVIQELRRRNYSIKALINHRPIPGVESIKADLFDPAQLTRAITGCSAVIHLIGIIAENPKRGVTFQRMHVDATKSVVDATKSAGVRRYLHMSALGTRSNAVSQYHRTKFEAEEYVRQSGLDWTIFRPSMIHGPRGEFMQAEAKWARKQAMPYLFMPYFGRGLFGARGAGKLQPVEVDDVARAFVDAIDKPQTIHRAYALAGSEILTWPQMHREASKQIVGKRRATLPIPAWYAKTLAAVVPRSWLPFNRDQVIMSQEDNAATETESAEFAQDFGWTPRRFSETLADYADQL